MGEGEGDPYLKMVSPCHGASSDTFLGSNISKLLGVKSNGMQQKTYCNFLYNAFLKSTIWPSGCTW